MNKKAIIFDFFGVICSEISPFWFEKYFSKNEMKQLENLYTPPADLGKISEDEFFGNIGALVKKTADEVRSEFEDYINIDDGMVNLIKRLKPTYKLGLCSNSPSNFIRSILVKYKLENLFNEIVISSECGLIKPDRKIYKLILGKLSTKATDSIFIDDNSVNIEAARTLGIKAILFSDSKNLELVLTNFGVKIS